jgi:drug/metabolite transporter (DMT)-like permease
MTAGLYGLLAALGWGGADFIARFTGRAIGHQQALLGMLSVGAIAMSLIIFLFDIPLVFVSSGWWLLLITGIGTMISTLLLYWGLARGPVTIVAPIVGSFPLFNVILALILGSRPDKLQWIAMSAVFIGVWLIAYASSHFESHPDYNRQHLRQTIIIALVSALGFGITVAAAQAASPIYGELQTVCIARWISLLSLALIFLWKKQVPVITLSCWPLIGLQGFMDTGAYAALAWSAQAENPEIAVVTASGFSIVTILLARVFLKEKMSWTQWCGVLFIIIGVVVLSSFE